LNHFLLICLCIGGCFYCGVLIWLIYGMTRLNGDTATATPYVSVIIAARNEAVNIQPCLEACFSQTYPSAHYEVIAVNDRSQDQTGEILTALASRHHNLKVLTIHQTNPHMAPKKWALETGISHARGEIILTTDADCRPSRGWIESMTACFTSGVALVAGYSPLAVTRGHSLLQHFIALEALGLASVSAGSFGGGVPLTCSGRNLAYRKSVFHEIGGFRTFGQVISGDDDLLLHAIRRKTGYRVRFATAPSSVVPSEAADTFRAFSQQRIRHASKGLRYDNTLKFGLIAVYLFYLSLLISFFFPSLLRWTLGILAVKSVLELTLLTWNAERFGRTRLLWFYPAAALFHIPYVVIFGFWGQIGRFHWKNQRFSKTKETRE
jgi:cellulose synthase/poly-beta-1,6-N-acetylglucosamine synthase-like glycosyltransferase